MTRRRGRESAPCFAVTVNGLESAIAIRRDPRARRFTLRVDEARREAILTLPLKVSWRAANDFLSRHRQWLEGRLAALPQPVPLDDGIELPLRGAPHAVRFVGAVRGRGVVWTQDTLAPHGAHAANGTAWSGVPTICVTGTAEHAPRRLLDWLKREARKDLAVRVAWHADRLGLKAKRLLVRDQATRWGSCSSTGSLSFSWRLVLAPPVVLDYVAAHEVAHLKEMNHGPRFWRLVHKTMPHADEARRWLKRNGGDLHRYNLD